MPQIKAKSMTKVFIICTILPSRKKKKSFNLALLHVQNPFPWQVEEGRNWLVFMLFEIRIALLTLDKKLQPALPMFLKPLTTQGSYSSIV